jgi:hypothetical protein
MSMAYQYNGCTSFPLAFSRRTATNLLLGSGTSLHAHTLNGANETANFTYLPGLFPAPTVDGTFRITYSISFTPYQIPAQSQLPSFTYVSFGGVAQAKQLVTGPDFNKQWSSGGGMVDVIATPRPTITIFTQFTLPNKFCYVTGERHIERLGPEDLSPDP